MAALLLLLATSLLPMAKANTQNPWYKKAAAQYLLAAKK
jgi:hypothetical protein